MQVRHQQRILARPEQRVAAGEDEFVTGEVEWGERNGNHVRLLPRCSGFGKVRTMDTKDARTDAARTWFETLRDRICAEFETIEREAGSDAAFAFTEWSREEDGNDDPGGGVQGAMKGKVFEKVGVNVSTVRGSFAPDFAASVNGASADNPGFTATGISLVAHMANPHVPAVHMNCRFLTTGKAWFGGGADLNPPIPYEEDTADFHARLRAACAAHNPTYYDRFSKWADDYFYIPHRKVHRGVGGIFYDHLECDDGEGEGCGVRSSFRVHEGCRRGVSRHFPAAGAPPDGHAFDEADRQRQLEWRGRYAEFNLVYDRGTLFGLKTGGNIDAILMSLPPRRCGPEPPVMACSDVARLPSMILSNVAAISAILFCPVARRVRRAR